MILPVMPANLVSKNSVSSMQKSNVRYVTNVIPDSFTKMDKTSFGDGGNLPVRYCWHDADDALKAQNKILYGSDAKQVFTKYMDAINKNLDDKEKEEAIKKLKNNPEITRFKGLGEISPDEFKHFIGPSMRLDPVILKNNSSIAEMLSFYMGKNTPERQNFIIDNLRVELDFVEN